MAHRHKSLSVMNSTEEVTLISQFGVQSFCPELNFKAS